MLVKNIFFIVFFLCNSLIAPAQWGQLFSKISKLFIKEESSILAKTLASKGARSILPEEIGTILKRQSIIINDGKAINYNEFISRYKNNNGKDKDVDLFVFNNEYGKKTYDLIDSRKGKHGEHISLDYFETEVTNAKEKYKLPHNNKSDKSAYEVIAKEYAIEDFKKTACYNDNQKNNLSYCIELYQIDNNLKVTGSFSNETVQYIHNRTSSKIIQDQFSRSGLRSIFGLNHQIEDRCIKFLKDQHYLSSKHQLDDALDIRIAILKYQKDKGVQKTGYFEGGTSNKILETLFPTSKKYPNWQSHFYIPYSQSNSSFKKVQLPTSGSRKMNLGLYEGFGFLNKDIGDESYILCNAAMFADAKEGARYRNEVSKLIDQIPEDLSSFQQTLFVFTMKSGEREYTTVLFPKQNQLIGYVNFSFKQSFGSYFLGGADALKTDIRYLTQSQGTDKIIWFGEKMNSMDVVKEADALKIPVLRRVSFVNKQLPNLDEQEKTLFETKRAVVCNAVPSTKEELVKANQSLLGLENWKTFHNSINENILGKFNNTVSTKQEFKDIIINGDDNLMLIVAHSDGMKVFIGKEVITIQEIKTWPKRIREIGGNRTAVLLVCESGKMDIKKGLLFKKRVESLTELLINKGYMDIVISPDHEINSVETLKILQGLRDNYTVAELRQLFQGWYEWIFNNLPEQVISQS